MKRPDSGPARPIAGLHEAPLDATMPEEHVFDAVGDASMDSFPASDPPSWTGMRLGPPH